MTNEKHLQHSCSRNEKTDVNLNETEAINGVDNQNCEKDWYCIPCAVDVVLYVEATSKEEAVNKVLETSGTADFDYCCRNMEIMALSADWDDKETLMNECYEC